MNAHILKENEVVITAVDRYGNELGRRVVDMPIGANALFLRPINAVGTRVGDNSWALELDFTRKVPQVETTGKIMPIEDYITVHDHYAAAALAGMMSEEMSTVAERVDRAFSIASICVQRRKPRSK